MPKTSDCLSTHARWELAVQTIPPASLARTFAREAGSFYDRQEFDALARHVRCLYERDDPELAERFCTRLDRRLYDRYHVPVRWDVESASAA